MSKQTKPKEVLKPKGSYTLFIDMDDEGKDVAEITLNPLTRMQFGQVWRLVQSNQSFMAGEFMITNCWHSGDPRLEKARDGELSGGLAAEAAYRMACIKATEMVDIKSTSIKKN